MQVEALAALAPVLARHAIVVDGPLEAAVAARLAAGGDLRATLADLAAPLVARGVERVHAVEVARTVVVRLQAAGAVEQVAAGFRLVDPGLAAVVRDAVATLAPPAVAVVAPPARPAAVPSVPPVTPVPVAPAGPATSPAPAPPVDASRLSQLALASRVLPTGVLRPATAAPPPSAPLSPVLAELAARGWVATTIPSTAGPSPFTALPTTRASTGQPGPGTVHAVAAPASTGPAGPSVEVVVADPRTGPVTLAARTAVALPTRVVHVPVPPLAWGRVDRAPVGPVADLLAASSPRVLVVDRPVVPAVVLLAVRGSTPDVVVLDLRSPVPGRGGGAAAAPSLPGVDPVAAALAGAAGAAGSGMAPRRGRARAGPAAGRGGLLRLLFGPAWADVDEDADDRRPSDHGVDSGGSVGLVVTSRTADVHADALATLLGVEVRVLPAGEDLGEEVLAWLEEDGLAPVLLAPRG